MPPGPSPPEPFQGHRNRQRPRLGWHGSHDHVRGTPRSTSSSPSLTECTVSARARRRSAGGGATIDASELSESAATTVIERRKGRSILVIIGFVLLTLLLATAVAAAWWLNNDRTRLQGQVFQQSLQVLEMREKLTRTEVALQERLAALATRDAALAEANRAVIPVRVTFRLAFMGQGLVASIRNVTDRPLNVIAELRDAGAQAERSVSLALGPNGTTEIGYAQGWTITSGQSISVSSSGYRSVTAFAP